MNHGDLEKRIDNIIATISGGAFEDDVSEANAWKENVKRAFLTKGVEKHEGIQLIIKRFIGELENINLVLLNANSIKLSDIQRDSLLNKKNLYQEFLSLFPEAEQSIQQVEELVKDNEEFLGIES